MTWEEWQRQDIRASLWIMYARTERIEGNIRVIKNMIQKLQRVQENEMTSLADIKSKVEAEKTVEDSMVTLLQSINQQLKDAIANDDPAAMQEIVDMLDNNTRVMSDAVTANTPAAPSGGDTGTGDTGTGDTGTEPSTEPTA